MQAASIVSWCCWVALKVGWDRMEGASQENQCQKVQRKQCLFSLKPKQGRASKKAKVLWSPGTSLAGRRLGCLYLNCVKVDPFLSHLQMLPREAFIICAFGLALKGNCSRTAYGKRSANAIGCELAKFCPHLHPCSLIAFSEVALISPMAEFVWDVIERQCECIM